MHGVVTLGCMLNVGLPVQRCKAVICMPVTTPEIKIEAVRRLGGQVKLVGETYSETQTYAQVQPCDNYAFLGSSVPASKPCA